MPECEATLKEPSHLAAVRPLIVRDLLTHTSSFTYDFLEQHPAEALYRSHGIAGARPAQASLADFTRQLAQLPLLFSPGSRWNYGVSTDVCGRLVEVLSGEPLDRFFAERIFAPLGMTDTGFFVPGGQLARFATCYEKDPVTREVRIQDRPATSPYLARPGFLSGGGGLVSTAGDYLRFCRMLLGGGALDGGRLLGPRTVAFMTANHLPGNRTLREMGDSRFSETGFEGTGFGLGFSVVLDPVQNLAPGSPGAYSWGGLASTFFWVDPAEELIAIFMAQLIPADSYPLRPQFQQLVYAAIVE
ncbi:MAG: serine hydrolase domain-containing protein [Deferrisomatales bacterium]